MVGKKQISFLLYGLLLFVFLQALITLFATQSFINKSVVTQAKIMSVTKRLLSYETIIRFGTKNNTLIEARSYLLLKPRAGKIIEIRYHPLIPSIISENVFYQIWYSLLEILTLLAMISAMVYIVHLFNCRKLRRDKKIKNAGNHIYTSFREVEAILKVTKNGRHPYQIISEWKDSKTDKTYSFKSEYIWENPIEYILDKSIKVMIDQDNKKSYLMDLSFLPQHLI